MQASLDSVLLLDFHGDALLPAGYTEVNTEVAWLETASALSDTHSVPPPVLVRGEVLCQWAKLWWEARGGETKKCESPSKRLRDLYRELDANQAQQLLQELPSAAQQNPPMPVELLMLLYPEVAPWLALPAYPSDKILHEHLAHWLLWVVDGPASWPSQHRPILRAVTAAHQLNHPQAAALWLIEPVDATRLVLQWLGVSAGGEIQPKLATALAWAGSFPLPLPHAWHQRVHALFVESLPNLPSDQKEAASAAQAWWSQLHPNQPTAIRAIAASVLADFVRANPSAASLPLLHSLAADLPADALAQLRSLVPPPLPQPLPNAPADVLDWATRSYLPYRQWQVSNKQETAAAHIRTAARAFGEWLLQVYPTQLLDAAYPYQQLYWAKKANHPGPNEVVIWVIADGLGWSDAQSLLRLIAEKSAPQSNGVLTATLAQPCFGLLPTITSHTKEPLRWGVPYSLLAEATTTAPADLKSNANLTVAAKNAQPGSLLVWRPYDPDPIYHQHVDAEVAVHLVQGALGTLAARIADAANAVPPGPTVRVLITTDHGRLLSDSPRDLLAPSNCQVEGRTAHLPAAAPPVRPAPDTDDVRWLDPKTFCLPNWAGVTLGEAAFRVPVGDSTKGGRAPYPHGGVWPEEVVLPWLELVRDAGPIKIVATLTGSGRAGLPGTAQLRLRNDSRHTLTILQFNAVFGASRPVALFFNHSSGPLKTIELPVELPAWPDTAQAESGKLTVLVETASGQQLTFPVKAELQNTGLQDRGLDISAEFGI